MRKLALSILSLTGIVALTGCGENYRYEPYVVVEHKTPTKIYVDEPGLVMFVGDTKQVHANIRPLDAVDAELVYASTNNSVATVSDKGLVTAVGAGSATITISSKEDPTIFDEVVVGVEKNIITGTTADEKKAQQAELKAALTKQKKTQTENYGSSNNLTNVFVKNGYVISTTRDGEHYSSENVRQNFIASREGFFEFQIESAEIRSPGGNASFDSYGYIFFCNEDFDAHIYKYSDSAKRRCEVKAQDLLGKADETEVVCLMLDQFFVAGRKILTNQFTNALESSDISSGSTASRGGFSDGGVKSAGYFKSAAPTPQTVGNEDESDLNIPAGTTILYSTETAHHWTDGRIDASYGVSKFEYDLDGHHYVHTEISYTTVLLEEEVKIVYPNKDDYQKVDGLFDL